MIVDVGRALAEGDDHGVWHLELKPEKVLRASQGSYRLTDLGLQLAVVTDPGPGQLAQGRSVSWDPVFLAPEQIVRPTDGDGACDVYGLGALAHYALTGRPPFLCGSMVELFRAVKEQAPTPLRQLRADVPAGLEALVAQALQKDPRRRWPSAWAMAEAAADLLV